MSIEEAASSFTIATSPIVVSDLLSTTAVPSSEEAAAAAALSLGVDGGEQSGEATTGTLVGAFFDTILGEVTGTTAGRAVEMEEVAAAAAADSGGGRLSLMKKAS